jgi:hypothetical protein
LEEPFPSRARWFAVFDPLRQPEKPQSRALAFVMGAALPVTVPAALAIVFMKSAALPIAILALAVIVVLVARRVSRHESAPSGDEGRRGLSLEGGRLSFRSFRGTSAPVTMLAPGAPFGVTLLASPRRDRLIALLTSAAGTFYVGASFDAAARRTYAPLFDRAFTIVGDDNSLEAIGPDGEPLVLAPDVLRALLDALVAESPGCLDRFVLTDARGAALTLDGRHLCVGERAVDLNAPLEWRSLVFQEAFGQAIAVYQGTWIRQSGHEMVLVSLLPALGPPPGSDLDLATVDRAVLRDLRLMQASPESPPPSEQRVAIDRLFMLPVRSALDRAPRASHQPNRAQA